MQFWYTVSRKSHVSIRNRDQKTAQILREISGKRSDAPFEMLCAVAQSPPRVSSLFHAGSSALPGHAAAELLACMPTSSQLRSLISAYFMQDPARSRGASGVLGSAAGELLACMPTSSQLPIAGFSLFHAGSSALARHGGSVRKRFVVHALGFG